MLSLSSSDDSSHESTAFEGAMLGGCGVVCVAGGNALAEWERGDARQMRFASLSRFALGTLFTECGRENVLNGRSCRRCDVGEVVEGEKGGSRRRDNNKTWSASGGRERTSAKTEPPSPCRRSN